MLALCVSLSSPFAGLWLTTLPTDTAFTLSDSHFNSSSRLPPVDDLRHCFCGTSLTQHPLHFLNCNQLRSSFISRHDRLLQLFVRVSRLVGITVQIESHLDNQDSSRSDALFFFPSSVAHTDVSVIDSNLLLLHTTNKDTLHFMLLLPARSERINFMLIELVNKELGFFLSLSNHLELLVKDSRLFF